MAETINMPKLGFDMAEGTLVRWVKQVGENINKGDVLAEIETDKATVEVESSTSGIVRKLLVGEGAVVPIGSPIAVIGTKDEKIEIPSAPASSGSAAENKAAPPQQAALPSTPAPPLPMMHEESGVQKASPLARRIAREAHLELGRVKGTGPGGRITRRDVEAVRVISKDGKVMTISGKGTDSKGQPWEVNMVFDKR